MTDRATTDVYSTAPPPEGTVSVIDIDGTLVAIASRTGRYVAFDDTCTHRECPLSEGQLDDDAVTCPCHKSRFDLRTGEPLNGPATRPIRIRRVDLVGDSLLVER